MKNVLFLLEIFLIYPVIMKFLANTELTLQNLSQKAACAHNLNQLALQDLKRAENK